MLGALFEPVLAHILPLLTTPHHFRQACDKQLLLATALFFIDFVEPSTRLLVEGKGAIKAVEFDHGIQ